MGPGGCTAHDKHPARNIDWAAHAPGREMFGNTPPSSEVRRNLGYVPLQRFDLPFELEDVLSTELALPVALAGAIHRYSMVACLGRNETRHD